MQQEQQCSGGIVGCTRAAELFWLDLMLTGDALHAERAMIGALSCADDLSNPPNELERFSLRSFVEQALRSVWSDLASSIRRITLTADQDSTALPSSPLEDLDPDRFQQAMLQIDTFPRCVLVLRLFQKMSVAEISSFLKVNAQLLQQALTVGLIEMTRNLAAGNSVDNSLANAASSAR